MPAHAITYLKDSPGWKKKPAEGGVAGRLWATGGEKPMTTLYKKRIGRGCALEAGTGMNFVIM
jgi:hypothetical protein